MTIEKLKQVILKKNYKWFEDQPNIIAVRTELQVPDVFNDNLYIVYKFAGKENLFSAIITTEPGVVYQKELLNPKGCWVMMPNQMIDAYSKGYHKGKKDHRCLRSTGKIFGLREDDKNGIIGDDKDAVAGWVDGKTVGANFHGAVKLTKTKKVGPWSAGCQVHEDWEKKEEMMDICENIYPTIENFTYTLLEEKDLA